MNICESLTNSARLFGDKTAIVWKNKAISYAQLDQTSWLAARKLTEAGVESGDRVAIMLPNAPSFPVWYYGALRTGAIAVSVSTRLAGEEVRFVVEDCQAKIFVGNVETLSSAAAHLPECVNATIEADDDIDEFRAAHARNEQDTGSTNEGSVRYWHDAAPDDPALILYTSGTTGFPKGATLSHGNVRSNVHAFNHLCNMRSEDIVLLAVPLFHCFGQNALLNSVLNVGGTLVMQQKFDLNESKRLINEHKVTQLYGVPMMFQLLHDSCDVSELGSVNYCFSAAATLPIQVGTAWQKKFGMPIHEGYGLTETSPFASYNHRDRFVNGSIGMPIDCVEMKVVDTDTGKECGPDKLGELVIRGPNVMLGYWNRPKDTAQAIREGWFHSGDIGRVDEQGYFFIVDRVKDMIAIGGMKVFPAEVERVLLDHADVGQVAVVGVEDSVFGERVVAFIVATETTDSETTTMPLQLQDYAKQHLGSYKIPRQFFIVEKLPMNPSGKVLKTKLREIANEKMQQITTERSGNSPSASVGAVAGTLRPATLATELQNVHASERQRVTTQFLKELVCEISESDSVPNSNTTFIDAGLDSLMIVELAAQLQVETGDRIELPATLVFDYPRISDMSQFLVRQLLPDSPNTSGKQETAAISGKPSAKSADLRTKIEDMSEEQALQELMKELS